MLAERPRARRHVFSAHLELMDVESESRIVTRTRDLTMFGFRAEIKDCSWPVGTRVRVKIAHKASNFTAGARIVWVRKNTDLGVAFTDVTPKDQLILEKWIAGLRGSEVLAHSDSV
jgi:PilZ domain